MRACLERLNLGNATRALPFKGDAVSKDIRVESVDGGGKSPDLSNAEQPSGEDPVKIAYLVKNDAASVEVKSVGETEANEAPVAGYAKDDEGDGEEEFGGASAAAPHPRIGDRRKIDAALPPQEEASAERENGDEDESGKAIASADPAFKIDFSCVIKAVEEERRQRVVKKVRDQMEIAGMTLVGSDPGDANNDASSPRGEAEAEGDVEEVDNPNRCC